MKPLTIRPLSHKVSAVKAYSGLTKFQSWICRVFKITPQYMNYYNVEIVLNDEAFRYVRYRDIIQSKTGERWAVMTKDAGNIVLIISEGALLYHGDLSEFVLLYRTH